VTARLWPVGLALLLAACGSAQPAARLGPTEAARLALAWSAGLGGSIDGKPAVGDGLVVVGTEGGRLAALHEANGARAWTVAGLGPVTDSPHIHGGRVLVGSLSGWVYAFDEHSGRRLWSWHAEGDEPAIWSSPAVFHDWMLLGVGSQEGDTPLEAGRVVALDLSTGRPLWEECLLAECQPGDGVWSSFAVDGQGRGFIGVGNPDDAVLAIDTATGRRLWETSLHPDLDRDLDVGATPVLFRQGGRERAAVGSTGGDFAVLDAGTGQKVSHRTFVQGSAVHGLLGSPAYDGSRLYLPSASAPTGVMAVDPHQGEVSWRAPTSEPVYSSPALGDGVIAVGTGDVFGNGGVGRVLVLAGRDGRVIWSRDVHSAVWGSPAIAGSSLYVGDHAGTLFCFRS
jgi:outer membrane protein assembly factor BamB